MVQKVLFYSVAILSVLCLFIFIALRWESLMKALFPVLLGVLIAYMVNPLVKCMERKRLSRPISIILVYSLIVSLAVLLIIYVVPVLVENIRELAEEIPEIISSYRGLIQGFIERNAPKDAANEIMLEIDNYIITIQAAIMNAFRAYIHWIPSALGIIAGILIAFVLAYYFVRDRDRIKKTFFATVPLRWRENIEIMGRELHYVLSRFIQGQLLVALIIGIFEAVGLYIVQVKYALFLGLIGGISNIIPYFGPYIGAVPAVIVALLESPAKALWTVFVFVLVQQIDNSLLSPKMMEGKLGMHPVTTMVVVLIGGQLFGVLGMIIAVPVTAVIKTIGKRIVASIV